MCFYRILYSCRFSYGLIHYIKYRKMLDKGDAIMPTKKPPSASQRKRRMPIRHQSHHEFRRGASKVQMPQRPQSNSGSNADCNSGSNSASQKSSNSSQSSKSSDK